MLSAVTNQNKFLGLITFNKNVSSQESIIQLTSIFWLIEKLISYKVWGTNRLFPVIPIWEFLNSIPPFIHWLLFAISLVCIMIVMIKPKLKYMLALLFISDFFSCILDQNRFQPWEYQFLFSTLIILVYWNNERTMRLGLMFVIVGTFTYSGLHKLNPSFLNNIWDEMMLRRFFKVPLSIIKNPIIYFGGYILGIAEALCGIGLLFTKTKNKCAKGLIGMHIFTLLFLGPFGLRYNVIVWPWNLLMIGYLYVFFIQKDSIDFKFETLENRFFKVILLCWGILPAFSFVGFWDNYLSSNLYSGKLPLMAICIKDTSSTSALKPYYTTKDAGNFCNGLVKINLQNWAMKEMKVPPYPEVRIYKRIKETFIKTYPASSSSFFLFRHPNEAMNKQLMQ